jgi:hypothetical protein
MIVMMVVTPMALALLMGVVEMIMMGMVIDNDEDHHDHETVVVMMLLPLGKHVYRYHPMILLPTINMIISSYTYVSVHVQYEISIVLSYQSHGRIKV